jgi:hypothetical protein
MPLIALCEKDLKHFAKQKEQLTRAIDNSLSCLGWYPQFLCSGARTYVAIRFLISCSINLSFCFFLSKGRGGWNQLGRPQAKMKFMVMLEHVTKCSTLNRQRGNDIPIAESVQLFTFHKPWHASDPSDPSHQPKVASLSFNPHAQYP